MKKSSQLALHAVLLYCLMAGVWIIFSNRTLAFLVTDPVLLTRCQTYKGLIFVAVTAVFFYFMLRGQLRRWDKEASERIQTETTLRSNQEKMRAIFDAEPECLKLLEADATLHEINPAGLRMIEADSLAAVAGKSALPIVVAEDQKAVLAMLAAAARGEKRNLEFRIVGLKGTLRWMDMHAVPIRDPDTGRNLILAVSRDITERKRAEKQIAEQAAFLDKARDAIIACDLEGKILFWNKGAERIYGWTSQEVVGRNVLGILHTDSKKFEEHNGLTTSQDEWHGELHHRTKDRREITIEARTTLIRDDQGHPQSVLAINTDITERKKIEAQFMRAQRMESIGTLTGGIAHDLNNILAPIMMSIAALKATADNPQARDILETIEVSAQRGADIVRRVLSFTRGLEGERVEIQPRHLLKDIENIIKDTFPKDIRLLFSIPNDTWTILGDPTQVHQILLNLCVNARDAMPNGGSLTVGVENCVLDEQYAAMNVQAKAGRYVLISVSDSGIGMPPELLDKIFEPFFTTKELYQGTGLGLSMVMGIVKSHDGIINVYSEPGKGTTFKVYLPAMEISSEEQKKQTQQVSLLRGNGETVLVVDDETSILTVTTQTLQTFGYEVLTAMDGAEAIALYAKHQNEIAVVLTDMMMPVMDGPATIHALTRINPMIKIIAMSGFNTDGGMAKAFGGSAKHFLAKPYTAETLLKTLRALLDESPSGRA